MRKKFVFVAMGALLFAFCRFAEAQQREQIPKVGVLEPGPAKATSACNDGFRQSLRNLGYIEKKNILFENRYGEFKLDRLRELAADLARTTPTVIWTHSLPGAQAAKQATTVIPIGRGVWPAR